ncbi:MAG: UDP-N-acetylglucosamine 1-carboxyvinyltransferase [Chloroflexi bacterium]|nr:UDP-N-acetylglucosamine 1-carboxyvinyltransferase [Chloroflexota bacterium]MCY4245954.1 UDP-N-acetylglucosamine 1-carboxyvinyltransferase [Chloroflexota bacterium]
MIDTAFRVYGGQPLQGELYVQRAKNAILAMIAAAIVVEDGETTLRQVPDIEDVDCAFELLRAVGAKVAYDRRSKTARIDASGVNNGVLPADLAERFRGSVLFLAPLQIRLGYVELPGSGGCDIGTRKIDFHHRGFARLGARVQHFDDGRTIAELAGRRFRGTLLYLDWPSHTGTENLMLAAALAEGQTILENASVEPEVIDFGNFLNAMGADIRGLGTSTVFINGVQRLRATDYTPVADRLVAGTFMMAAAITGGDVTVRDVEPAHLRIVCAKLEQMGVAIDIQGRSIRVQGRRQRLNPINIQTYPYPGFPTDLQPCVAALSCLADGTSYIRERVFDNRYDYAEALLQMGADIIISQGGACVIKGVDHLKPARLSADNIRAGATILLAALATEGESTINNVYQIDRGYEGIDELLSQLGANITRVRAQSELQTA